MSILLTVDDIRNVSFRRANFGGYKPEDVDAFIDDVEDSYQKILDRNQNLCGEIENLKRKIEKLQGEDSTIKKLILNAKEIADGTLSKAKEKTAEMVFKASKESEKIMARAKKEVDFQKEIFNQLKIESANLRKKLDDVYKEHIKVIDSIPSEFEEDSEDDEYVAGHVMKSENEDFEEEPSENLDCLNISSQDDSYVEIESSPAEDTTESIDDIISGNLHNEAEDLPKSESEKTYKDLKFGKDYNISEDESDTGAYSGLFKK